MKKLIAALKLAKKITKLIKLNPVLMGIIYLVSGLLLLWLSPRLFPQPDWNNWNNWED